MQMSPSDLRSTHLEADRVISTFSFDPNLQPSQRIPIKGRPSDHLSHHLEWLGHLLEGGLRSSGMPHMGFADPVTNDEPRFHSNMPASELTERDTRTIEASVVSSAHLVAEAEDGVTRQTRPTPIRPQGARGSSHSI